MEWKEFNLSTRNTRCMCIACHNNTIGQSKIVQVFFLSTVYAVLCLCSYFLACAQWNCHWHCMENKKIRSDTHPSVQPSIHVVFLPCVHIHCLQIASTKRNTGVMRLWSIVRRRSSCPTVIGRMSNCWRIFYAKCFFIRHLGRRTSGICSVSRDLDTTTTGRLCVVRSLLSAQIN